VVTAEVQEPAMQDSQPGPSDRTAGDGTRPVLARGRRGSTDVIHENLRIDILSGVIAPGSELSQAQVAKDFGVSRGPVREAFRLLQREGLIEAEVNHRATVTELSVQEVEHVYALRVANEALALSISVPRFTTADFDELDRLVIAVDEVQGRDFATWEEQHQKFHALLLSYAGRRMRHSLSQWAEYTARYRRVYVGDATGGWTLGAPEHAQIAQACRARDEATAVSLLARHLSRAALTLIAMMDPTHDPTLLRAAVRQVTASVEVSYGQAQFDGARGSGARRRRTTSSRSA
jgi:DNA-binding GntR family transcriptional regulator